MKVNEEKPEGGSYSKLIQMMQTFGYNKDVDVELATVLSVEPLKIKVDNMNIELEGTDLIVAEQLLEHKRTLNINQQPMTVQADVSQHDISATSSCTAGGSTIPNNNVTFTTLGLDAEVSGENIEVTIMSKLEVGDRVIVASIQDNQIFVVLDKAVI
ncbi:DUF2577 domain-containing protein [Longirhabdus pacifica]|uniref:DUF2577 domain-containing protein n=1 Tax=Longirhabdus pacifica TaxID=2305227 RepID=UPI0010091242|nr:DUF2577 family protein [Longirhabdus pacifica]